MILKSDRITELLANPAKVKDPLVITPQPSLDELRRAGSSSVDLRLGTWFVTLRQSRFPLLDVSNASVDGPGENRLTRKYYIPFGKSYILHPRNFVLGATLEWIRLPRNLAGYVVGKSSWGRRGLVIATATGVHPGFAGCLTLEITNLGEMPIAIRPGMQICQLCLHAVESASEDIDRSSFSCHRRPTLGSVKLDTTAQKLAALGVP
jgi:dCTP deaminase